MGWFSPYEYKSKKTGQKFYLHYKDAKKTRLYYFSKDPVGALNDMPRGFEVVENQMQGVPFMKKIEGGGGLLGGLGGKKKEEGTKADAQKGGEQNEPKEGKEGN